MDKNDIAVVERQICYSFKNKELLRQAFIRRSYSKENGGENNEVLEFIGDKVLDLVIVKLLAEKYGYFIEECDDYNPQEDWNEFASEYSEGKLTGLKKKLVCREMLARRIRMFGFQYMLLTGKGDVKNNISEQESVQEDLFEAILGAVALDCGWDLKILTEVVGLMLNPEFYLDSGFDAEDNYVELVQQWYQEKYRRIPVYQFPVWGAWYHKFYSYRPDNILCQMAIAFDNEHSKMFEEIGHTRAEARMKTAKQAYEYLKENGLLFTWVDEIGEPELDRAINQLQELYQKGYIGEPWYRFEEKHDRDGNPVWQCECHIEGMSQYWHGEHSSKKQGKKSVAYDMLCEILRQEGEL